MILDWLGQTPALLAALLIVFVPGLLALRGVGVRGLALVAGAPLFGISATAVSALVLGALGIPWNPLSWGVSIVLLVGVAWGIGRMLGHRLPDDAGRGPRWVLITAICVGVIIGFWRLAAYIQEPGAVSQTNDAVFHMNAVRFAIEKADASSLHINAVIGGRSFYPGAWHAIVSLVVLLTGVEIAIAANMLTLVIGALIWPLGIAWLTARLTGSRVVAGYAAILSGSLQTFPLLMFQWGVLFPNALSTAIIPAAVATVVALPVWSAPGDRWRNATRGVLLVLVAAAALLLSQPAAFLPWAAICAVWMTWWIIRLPETRVAVKILVPLLVWGSLAVVWWFLARSTSGSHWPPFRGKLQAVVDVLLNGHVLIPFAFGVSALMLIGIAVAVRRPALRWFVVAWAGISGLYVLVASVGAPLIRVGVLGAWYADPYRIAALAPIVVIPLAAIGADLLLRAATRRLGAADDAGVRHGASVAVLSVFVTLLVVLRPVDMPAVTEGTFDEDSRYSTVSEPFLSPDERTLLESLDELVPEGERVLGNPSTGTGFGYFLSGRDVYPRTWAQPRNDAWKVLSESLRYAADEPAVCEALSVYSDPQYVLDFGLGEEGPGRYELPGMTDFAGQPGFVLVSEVGEASLWRITACAQ